MNFSKQQLETINTRGKNIIVSASAGSGKTSVLVERLAKLIIDEKVSVENILAMTFTNDAAAEMKARLKKKLSEADIQDEWIQNQMALLETANISTIDSFCSEILKQNYYHLHIPYPMANTLIDDSQKITAQDNAYHRAIHDLDLDEFSFLKMYMDAYHQSEEDLKSLALRFIAIANAKPDPKEWIQSNYEIHFENYKPYFFKFFTFRIKAMLEVLEFLYIHISDMEYQKISKQESDLKIISEKIQALQSCLLFLEKEDYQSFKQSFLNYMEGTRKIGRSYNKYSFANEQSDLKKFEQEILDVLFDESQFLEDEKTLQPIRKAFLDLAVLYSKYYQEEKRKMEVIDFNDMEHFAYEILKIPAVQEEMRNRFEHILVDEFQDTNDLQEAIVQTFARENNVFRVGDIKQSIYGFRQARPQIMKEYIDTKDPNFKTIVLAENYRSNESIVNFNNDFYEKIMANPILPVQFTKQDIALTGTEGQKTDKQYPVRFLYTEYGPWAAEHNEGLITAKKRNRQNKTDMIAQDILKQHKSGHPYRSICVLTRTHSVQEEVKKGLEAWGIPVLAEIDHGFYTNQAIQVILAALSILIDPNDDISMTAFLCSYFGGLKQEQLASLIALRPSGASIYQTLRDTKWLKAYEEIRRYRNQPLSSLLKNLYNYKNYYYGQTSRQDKTNLDLLMEMASQSSSLETLEDFVCRVQKEAKLDKISEAYPFGKEEDVVKIKTMHHAKGLQYPIVYIYSNDSKTEMDLRSPLLLDPDLGLAFKAIDKNMHLLRNSRTYLASAMKKFQESLQEEMRLFYVATTRAEKELVIVDTIKEAEEFNYPLNHRALLKNRSYTSWLLHTYHKDNHQLNFDIKLDLLERPVQKEQYQKAPALITYSKENSVFSSQTASQAKKNLKWQPIILSTTTAMKRGTLFHTLAAKLPYPYEKKEIEKMAEKYHYDLQLQDVKEIMQLNDNSDFAKWMKEKHQFECSYIVEENHVISHGFMDFVAFEKDTIHIVDFKTDMIDSMEQLESLYKDQLSVYKKAMEVIYPDKKVKTYLYSFHLGKLWEIL